MSCKCWCFSVDCSNTVSFVRRYSSRRRNKKIVLLLVGLDNAGKSCTALRLADEPVEKTIPTVGFNVIKLKHKGHPVIIYDLGGGSQIRDIWTSYFGDVHGVIFVVDASDLNRINESRKALQELLSHEKLCGKPLLLLANKQDREGALDEIDIVEKLNVETLVNQQRCPTLVETCSAAGAPRGKNAKVDPGILNGYRWLIQWIINNYDALNSRVQRDIKEMRVEDEAKRQKWLQERQDTAEQIGSLSSECEENPFKSIDTLVGSSDKNGHISKPSTLNSSLANGHVIHVRSSTSSDNHSQDSPDGSSHAVEGSPENSQVYIPLHSPKQGSSNKNGHISKPSTTNSSLANGHIIHVRSLTSSDNHSQDSPDGSSHAVDGSPKYSQVYIPLHSPKQEIEPAEPDILIVGQAIPVDVVTAVKEQFEWKMQKQKHKKKLLHRSNRTAPTSASSVKETKLPPLRTSHSNCQWARPSSAKSLPSQGWGLSLALEEVEPRSESSEESLKLEVIKPPHTLVSSVDLNYEDNDDVVTCSSFTSSRVGK